MEASELKNSVCFVLLIHDNSLKTHISIEIQCQVDIEIEIVRFLHPFLSPSHIYRSFTINKHKTHNGCCSLFD